MSNLMRVLAALSCVGLVAGCAGEEDAAPAAAAETTEQVVEEETTTTSPTTTTEAPPLPDGAPEEPLAATGPEWVEACALGDTLVDQSWEIEAGIETDKTKVAVSLLGLIEILPEGVAEEEISYVRELLNTFVGGGDLEPYRESFDANAQGLLDQVAQGCGAAEGESLPLPEGALTEVQEFLFP